MLSVFVFRNKSGELGIFQKDNDSINLCVAAGLSSISTSHSWSEWTRQIDAGYAAGDKENPTERAVSFFLRYHAEIINHEVTELHKVKSPGGYYPRIARENINFNYVNNDFLQDIRAYRNIQNSLDELFNYIEPSTINLKAYGHKIRELLILACTEVEYLLLKTLVENGYDVKDRYSTVDYIKCKEILRLDEFEVHLAQHQNIKNFSPFLGWDENKPTKSLPWYDAYNSVKHNRNDNIGDANLEHLLDAISAIHILLESQYGNCIFKRWESQTDDRSIFNTTEKPTWDCTEVTVPILEGNYCSIKSIWNKQLKYFEDNPI